MEEKSLHPIAYNDQPVGTVKFLRDAPPADYMIRFESFSLISNTKIEKYESSVFESGGYKWKLSLYPRGNAKRNGSGHVSLYLAIADTKSLPLGWEVNVNFRMFVLNQKEDKYLTIQDGDVCLRRFHKMRTEWGFDQLMSLNNLNDDSNGYIVDDSRVFGVEVYVVNIKSVDFHLKTNWQ